VTKVPNETWWQENLWRASVDAALMKGPTKAIVLRNPTNAENVSMFYTPVTLVVSAMHSVVVGSTPSVTFSIRHGSDRSAAGTELVTGGTTCTNETSGVVTTSFDAATISPGWVWITTTAKSGTVDQLNLTLWLTPEANHKGITIANPGLNDKIVLGYEPGSKRIVELRSVVKGSGSPSCTWSLRHGTDVSGTGTEVVTGGIVTTNTTTGLSTSSFNSATYAQKYLWLEITALSGTVDQLSVTVIH
jgi:hypothetical protein